MSNCVVFVCNKRYFNKFVTTCSQLVSKGNYNGDICLIVDEDFKDDNLLKSPIIVDNNIMIKTFDKIQIPKEKYKYAAHKNKVDGCILKFNLFHTFFKQWDYIFYLDCGMKIFSDINPILNESCKDTILAHSDAYPTYKRKLHGQFAKNNEYFTKLETRFDLNVDYFQSTIMLYDTNIITESTLSEIIGLLQEYPIGILNDQCYLSLYFINVRKVWRQIAVKNDSTYFYDYLRRNNKHTYIMLKMG